MIAPGLVFTCPALHRQLVWPENVRNWFTATESIVMRSSSVVVADWKAPSQFWSDGAISHQRTEIELDVDQKRRRLREAGRRDR